VAAHAESTGATIASQRRVLSGKPCKSACAGRTLAASRYRNWWMRWLRSVRVEPRRIRLCRASISNPRVGASLPRRIPMPASPIPVRITLEAQYSPFKGSCHRPDRPLVYPWAPSASR
jgi:hypothetical protein